MMRKLTIIIILVCFGCALISAQKSTARIENIRTHMKDKSLVVRYDIIDSEADSPHQIDFVVVDNRGHVVKPDSVTGDFGPHITPGLNKEIVWEIYKEFDIIYGGFSPRITIDAADSRKHIRGPEYAALSLLVPGLGDYFVADPKDMKIKPYLKTATTLGLLGLSWAAMENREAIPPVIAPPGFYVSADALPGETLLYIDHYWEQEPASTGYWLFPYDSEIILGIGIASWLFDVIWVARKGVVNNRIYNNVIGHISVLPVYEGLLLSYRIQF